MRLDYVRIAGLTSAGEVEIDLTAIPAGIVALVGPNGAGKTTILEAAPAAWYRTMPTRGDLYPYVRDRAEIEVRAEHDGHDLRSVVTVDRARKRQTATLWIDGDEVTDGSGGVRVYDQAIAGVLPPLDLFLAAAFSAQDGRGSFSSADQAQRRALLRRALGLDRWQGWWRSARDAGGAIDRAVTRARDQIADLDDQRAAAEAGRRLAEDATRRLTEAQAMADQADQALEEAIAAHRVAEQTVQEARRREEAHRQRADELRAAKSQAESHVERAEADLADCQRTADALDTIRERIDGQKAAAQEIDRVRHAVDAARAERDRLAAERRAALATWKAAEAHVKAAEQAVAAAETAAARVRQLHTQIEDLQEAGERLQAAEMEIEELTRDGHPRDRISLLETRRSALEERDRQLCGLIEDAEQGAALIERVPCSGEISARCELLERARASSAHLDDLRGERDLIAGELRELHDARDVLRDAVARHDEARDRAGRLRSQVAQMATLRAELDATSVLAETLSNERDRLASATTARDEALRTGEGVAAELDAAEGALEETERTLAALPAMDDVDEDDLRRAEQAAARLPVLSDAVDRARAAMEEADLALRTHMDASEHRDADAARQVEARRRDVVAARQARVDAQAAVGDARAAQAAAERQAEIAERTVSRYEDILRRLRPIEKRRRCLHALEAACGSTGVQALEMDAAGPGISDAVNAILEVAYGGRFSVALQTQAERVGGGMREVCDVVVLDAEKGWEGPIGSASGGERVAIEAALRLGIGAYLRSQGGDWRTIWLDEADGALDAERAERWPSMLRAAARMSGSHHLLVVSHRETVWRQADTVIRVGPGGAQICDPGEV